MLSETSLTFNSKHVRMLCCCGAVGKPGREAQTATDASFLVHTNRQPHYASMGQLWLLSLSAAVLVDWTPQGTKFYLILVFPLCHLFLYCTQVVSLRILICLQSQVCHLIVFSCLYDVFHFIRYIQGYKEREIIFRTGGLGRHMQEDVYESWVCMDHYCGDPVFCWVYNEIDKVFTPWGTNSELRLITGL